MAVHVKRRAGFATGLDWITTLDEREEATGIALGVWRLSGSASETMPSETAFLLMGGEVEVSFGGRTASLSRRSLFDEAPSALHVCAGEKVSFRGEAELTVYRTTNQQQFTGNLYLPADVRDEHRGKGLLQDASYRFVRTIFDRTNAPSAAELVLGEVVTFPGRWSSYPPHHHPQPEIYHYRFTSPDGYGHAELGESVVKVRHGDTIKILDGVDHPQCAAPGYGMYYSWVIRHLPDRPYDKPEFDPKHAWTLDPKARFWWPKGT